MIGPRTERANISNELILFKIVRHDRVQRAAELARRVDADSAVRGAEIYQVGDEVDGRRIVAVSESTVVLEGAAGRTVLRLHPAR